MYFESLSTTLDYCYWLIVSVKRENNIVRRNYIRYTFSDHALRVSCEKEASRDKNKYNTENKYFYKYQLPHRIGIKRYWNFRHYYNRMIQQSDRIYLLASKLNASGHSQSILVQFVCMFIYRGKALRRSLYINLCIKLS